MLSILGAKLSNLYQFPLFEVFRLSGFGDFQRVELFFFILWFITGIITIILYYQGLSLIVQDLFSLQDYKALILPLGLCLVVFTLYMFPNTVEYQLLGFKYMPSLHFSCKSSLPQHPANSSQAPTKKLTTKDGRKLIASNISINAIESEDDIKFAPIFLAARVRM